MLRAHHSFIARPHGGSLPIFRAFRDGPTPSPSPSVDATEGGGEKAAALRGLHGESNARYVCVCVLQLSSAERSR